MNSSLVYEEKLQDSLKTSFEEQRQMRIKQFYSDMEAERQKNENERKERILEQEAINRQEIEGLTTRLKHESFYDALYKENNQSFVYGDAVVNALIDTYKKNRNEYNNFYQAITQVFKAKELSQDDPVSALRISKKHGSFQNTR